MGGDGWVGGEGGSEGGRGGEREGCEKSSSIVRKASKNWVKDAIGWGWEGWVGVGRSWEGWR